MFRVERSNKGKPSIIDRNQFKYVANGESMSTARWRCSKRECKATLQTTKSYSSLIGESLPDHNHINNLLKRAAKDTEAAVLTNLNGNTGRKQRYLDAAGRIKFLVDGYTGQMSKMDYARSIAGV